MLGEYVLRIALSSAAISVLSAVLPEGGAGKAAKRALALAETVIITEPLIGCMLRWK